MRGIMAFPLRARAKLQHSSLDSSILKAFARASEAESKLKEDFEDLLVRLNEYISIFYINYLEKIFETIPKKVLMSTKEISY